MYANMRNFREWTMWQPASGASQLRNYEYRCAFVVCFLFSSSRNKWVCVFFHFIICSFIFKLVLSLSISSVYTILRSPPEQRNEKKWNEMIETKTKSTIIQDKHGTAKRENTTPSLTYTHQMWKCRACNYIHIRCLLLSFFFLLSFSYICATDVYCQYIQHTVLHVERLKQPEKNAFTIIVVNILCFHSISFW